jgi:hypothetical protein
VADEIAQWLVSPKGMKSLLMAKPGCSARDQRLLLWPDLGLPRPANNRSPRINFIRRRNLPTTSASRPTPEVNPPKADMADMMSVVGGESEVAGTGINEG